MSEAENVKKTAKKSKTSSMIEAALEARQRAYAPYSNFRVGASVSSKEGDEVFVGCNVENMSYGATVCAERIAIFSMIAQCGKREIDTLVVATETSPPSPPCALCLQVITEFADDCRILLVNDKGEELEKTLRDFLPQPFHEQSLKKSES